MRAIEAKFPDAPDLQKFSDANELFLAYQIGELSKRLYRLEEKQLRRTKVVGIVLASMVTMIGAVVGLLKLVEVVGILK